MSTTANTDANNSSDNAWSDDFDAARAKALVDKLRAELATVKGELSTANDTLKAERQARADESKTEEQKAADKLKAAEDRAKAAEQKLTVANVLRDFPALADYEDLLTGDDEAAIRAKAERLAKIGKTDDGGDADDAGDNGQGLPQRPEPNLTPGHGGAQEAPFDPDKIAEEARNSGY